MESLCLKKQCHNTMDCLSNLSIDTKLPKTRNTGIICTIGPSSRSVEVLQEMMMAGMKIARLNFSHGTHEYHLESVKLIREAEKTLSGLKRSIAIALDTKGPEIRTGLINGSNTEELVLEKGKYIKVTSESAYMDKCTVDVLYVDYEKIYSTLDVNSKIYVDDGTLCLTVASKGKNYLKCLIENGGVLGSKKGVNLPDVHVDLPVISKKDHEDLLFAVEHELDMIFASFIQADTDVEAIRKVLGTNGSKILIISKIENYQGVKNFSSILAASDGIMVARGDLGIEIPPEKVFIAQKMMISQCNVSGKPVVCATQMLESMTFKPRSTRAESNDVANAVLDGADCVMLSGETAKGKYVVHTIRHMNDVCLEAEAITCSRTHLQRLKQSMPTSLEVNDATALAAVEASFNCNATAIVVMTTTGKSAYLISRYRPRCPVIAITRNAVVTRQCNLYRGIIGLHYTSESETDWIKDVKKRINYGIEYCRKNKILNRDDHVIVMSGWSSGSGKTNTMQILKIDESQVFLMDQN